MGAKRPNSLVKLENGTKIYEIYKNNKNMDFLAKKVSDPYGNCQQ